MGKQFYLIVGNFGYRTNYLDGQTIKTREIYNLFKERSLNKVIYLFDTDQSIFRVVKMSWLLLSLRRVKHILYLPGLNNMKWIFPFLYFGSVVFKYRIQYFVIGGWLPNFIRRHPYYRRRLQRIDNIFVESLMMQETLKSSLNFDNVVWFPNFRVDFQVKKVEYESKKLKLVFLSRITPDKGIDTIFKLLQRLSDSPECSEISVDFYGHVDPQIQNWFEQEISLNKNSRYCGVIPPERVQGILSQYDAMLFPTRYPGEGCPGVIIEAYMASIPVVASDWKYNKEFVIEGLTGYLFLQEDITRLCEIIIYLTNNKDELTILGNNARQFAKKFTPDYAWKILTQAIDLA